MDNNKISVIVPVYNIGNYVDKSVNSILRQTYKNLEIILVDDGSTDNSGRIIDELAQKDSRIKVIHQTNSGVAKARIAGIKSATGEWIGFVDGDDYIEPNMYEVLLQNAVKHNADISHCGYQMVFPSHIDYYHNTKQTILQDNEQGLYDLLSGNMIEPALCNKLYKYDIVRSAIDNNSLNTNIKNNEDLLMNFYFFRQSKLSVFSDFCFYHYVLRKGSAAVSKPNTNRLYDPIKVQKTILEEVKGNTILSDIVYTRLMTFYVDGASMKNVNKDEEIKKYIKMCQTELKELKPHILNGRNNRYTVYKYKFCTFSPSIYRVVHSVYSKIKGLDKKYEVN